MRQELQEHITQFKQQEEHKREQLNNQIALQKSQIIEKEKAIKAKNESISKMEQDYEERMDELRKNFNFEKQKKSELDKEL